ncbi:poly-beta-1,6 N-acetyl-D-glucosamine export porin PgaA [Lysobacter sp. N42]|uniref:poly-beta-1,6 N-acetyl-D-glucosamine export porin PgaA n=1 Tax=Lysobacter sp. N42 TaxID=2545719 RepID=UPI00104A99A8|nr:poly-beta-1,6 N-acetyl-D-glucosamine export porin PgaA [Lysobacter sp. N42]TCZ88111.1 poly-beta-1,6 N-acetyl-D-glucosamine export porin PgaA [Lysobacter sp. N42]
MRPIPTALAVLLPLAWMPCIAQETTVPGGTVSRTAADGASAPVRRTPPALPPVTHRSVRDSLLARAEAHREREEWVDALAIYEHLLAADRRDDVAWRMRALTLADLGAAHRAAELLAEWPDAFADYQRDRIRGDAVARQIGWGGTYAEREQDRDVEMQRALEALRTLQTRTDLTNWERTRLRMDSLTALNALRRYEETVAEYEALQRDGVDLPAYVHGPAGDALLALRRPEEAAAALKKAIALDPSDVDTRILLAYAYLEQERFDLALPLVDELVKSQPAWPYRVGARTGYENWDRYKAAVAQASMISFAHDHARAQALLDELVRIGPRHSGTQAALGAVTHRRARPTAALERYDMALTLDPRNRDAAIGRVSSLLDLQRMEEARLAHRDVQARFRDDLHVARLDREVALRTGPEGRISWVQGRNDGDAPVGSPFGARDRRVELEAWTPIIGNRWRLGLLGDEVRAEFDPDTVRYRRFGAGVDYRYDRLGLRAAVYDVSEPDEGSAWTFGASWRINDAWRVGASVAKNDVDTSMQARRAGIEADSVAVAASWTPSDLAAVDGELKRFRYDDGNERDQASVFGRWRLHTAPHLLVDGLASGWWSRASETGRPYFNPERDAMATVGVRLDHILWRRYERHLRQRFEVNVGPYWQEGFGTRWVPQAAYRHEWRPAQGHTFEYGVSWSRPVYDGNRERRIAFEASYRWGF